jgi:beta-carotene hydroxylase
MRAMRWGPRNAKDWKTLLWAAVMPIPAIAQYARPSLVPWLAPLSCYLALCAGVIAHNHNHCPTFRSRRWNRIFGNWLSLFYGYPTFAWIPTHNLNHHRFVNRAGDATITWRYTNRHALWVALTYFFVSSYWQSDPIKAYIRKARLTNPRLYRDILSQYALWGAAALGTLSLALGLHGLSVGLVVWFGATAGPALFALFTIMLFNYEQHVHTDPWSEHNHSRSWTGGLLNFLLFNNGFHAAHHENPGMHWSDLPRAHAALAPSIDPRLVNGGMLWYFTRCYVLAPFFPRFGTTQVGRAPFDAPGGKPLDLTSADVAAAEAGENAVFVGLER